MNLAYLNKSSDFTLNKQYWDLVPNFPEKIVPV